MAEPQNQKAAKPEAAELDDAELLGFGHIGTESASSTSTEDAVGLALNKRGIEESVPSDHRLKTHVRHVGATADGLNLYSFRYLGGDSEFLGVMAQELLADERHSNVVELGADGYFRVDYGRLGLANLVTGDMLAASERALRRVPSLTN